MSPSANGPPGRHRAVAPSGGRRGDGKGGLAVTVVLLVLGGLLFLLGCGCALMFLLFLATGYMGWDLWLYLLVAVALPLALGSLALLQGFGRLESRESTERFADDPG